MITQVVASLERAARSGLQCLLYVVVRQFNRKFTATLKFDRRLPVIDPLFGDVVPSTDWKKGRNVIEFDCRWIAVSIG
jgi:hypothetical protein